MRTTIDLPDELFRRVKAASALKGTTLKSFIREAVERQLRHQAASPSPGHRVQLPLVPSAAPASVELSNERAAELLEEEELHVPSRR